MNGFELRWVLPEGTTTESPVLMFRTYSQWRKQNAGWSEWATVPIEVVKPNEFKRAKAGGNLS